MVRRQCLRLLLYRICSSDRARVSRSRARSTRAAGSRANEKDGGGGFATHGVAGAEADPLRNLAVLLHGLGQGLLDADCTQEHRPRTHLSARCPSLLNPGGPPHRNVLLPDALARLMGGHRLPQAHPPPHPTPYAGSSHSAPLLTALVGGHLQQLRRRFPRAAAAAAAAAAATERAERRHDDERERINRCILHARHSSRLTPLITQRDHILLVGEIQLWRNGTIFQYRLRKMLKLKCPGA